LSSSYFFIRKPCSLRNAGNSKISSRASAVAARRESGCKAGAAEYGLGSWANEIDPLKMMVSAVINRKSGIKDF
jgi:hypothetical protein